MVIKESSIVNLVTVTKQGRVVVNGVTGPRSKGRYGNCDFCGATFTFRTPVILNRPANFLPMPPMTGWITAAFDGKVYKFCNTTCEAKFRAQYGEKPTFELDPLTGSWSVNGACHLFNIVEAKNAPVFRRTRIFKRVFGPMEQLRIEEDAKCRSKDTKSRRVPREPRWASRLNPADMRFETLVTLWYNAGSNKMNTVFPISTDGYHKRNYD